MKSKVFFTKEISSDSLVKIFHALSVSLNGRVAVKISTGEPGGHNYLKPELIRSLVEEVHGTIVECNTAYKGKRFTTEDHLNAAREHGFMDIAPVDITDSDGEIAFPVLNGKHLKENFVGKNILDYDSMVMLSHFKGHPMGGFGGALKNASIGCASSRGKCLIHSAGKEDNPDILWSHTAEQNDFLESMAEAAKTIDDHFKGAIVYINVMNNLSVDCDCSSHPAAPKMKDIGILASLDAVSLDQACVDLVYQADDTGKQDLIHRIEEKNGTLIIQRAEEIGLGTRDYEIVLID